MKHKVMLIIMASIMTFCSSCDYKDLEEPEFGNVEVVFDYTKVDSIPAAMRVVFYPVSGDAVDMIQQGYSLFDMNKNIKRVELPEGVYDVYTWNNDGENVYEQNLVDRHSVFLTTDLSGFLAVGDDDQKSTSIIDSIYNGQKLRAAADYTVSGIVNNFHVDPLTSRQTVTLSCDSLVKRVNITIKGVGGLGFVSMIKGTLNNVAEEVRVEDGMVNDSVAVNFDCNWNTKEMTVTTSFHVWDIQPSDAELSHKLVLFFWMDDAKVFYPIDITKEVQEAYQKGGRIYNISKEVDINVRQGLGNDGGFDLKFDDWNDVEIEIPM